jgi:hypothetical protein
MNVIHLCGVEIIADEKGCSGDSTKYQAGFRRK